MLGVGGWRLKKSHKNANNIIEETARKKGDVAPHPSNILMLKLSTDNAISFWMNCMDAFGNADYVVKKN